MTKLPEEEKAKQEALGNELQEVEFEEIDVQIPFHKLAETQFHGVLLEREDRDNNESVILARIEGGEEDGKQVYLGGYSVISFFEHKYILGRLARITFLKQEKTRANRNVNVYKFEMEK